MTTPMTAPELDELDTLVDETLRLAPREIEAVAAVERGANGERFWYVRIDGDMKTHFSAEFTLGQRTLTVDSYFMPAPQENQAALFEHLLVRNRSMFGLQFCQGNESAIYLRGKVDNRHVDADTVNHLLGQVYRYTEDFFAPAMRIGFSSRFNS